MRDISDFGVHEKIERKKVRVHAKKEPSCLVGGSRIRMRRVVLGIVSAWT
jgi:hypothetical protein